MSCLCGITYQMKNARVQHTVHVYVQVENTAYLRTLPSAFTQTLPDHHCYHLFSCSRENYGPCNCKLKIYLLLYSIISKKKKKRSTLPNPLVRAYTNTIKIFQKKQNLFVSVAAIFSFSVYLCLV